MDGRTEGFQNKNSQTFLRQEQEYVLLSESLGEVHGSLGRSRKSHSPKMVRDKEGILGP